MEPAWLAFILFAAAVIGDAVNYGVGRLFGRAITGRQSRWVKQEHLERATRFFERHGGKAIVLARFVPIVRTFVPFVAGVSRMPLRRFWLFNVSGAIAWVSLFVGAGYLFGNLPWVERNLTLGMLGIVAVSVLPLAIEWVRHRRADRAGCPALSED
jgi:membrane-associated protein